MNTPEKDYSHRGWIAALALIAVLGAVSFIPPQSLGGVKLRRANILSDILSFEDAAAEAAFSPALCNRIDRNTCGLVLCAKNAAALQAMNEIMTQLYRRGLTVVSNRRGYGLYYTKGDTLQFLELQADNDHCADLLLQAAREKTGAQNARILLAENQTLYLGAGRRCGYGMIAFLGRPFPTTDAYFRMLL